PPPRNPTPTVDACGSPRDRCAPPHRIKSHQRRILIACDGGLESLLIQGAMTMLCIRLVRIIGLALLVFAPVIAAQEAQKYLLPPQHIIDVFDAEPPPQVTVNPNKQQLALIKARAYPTIAELAQPMLRLAGSRINPKTNGP